MHEIIIIQSFVWQNQKNIMKITKEGFKNNREIITEVFPKKKKTQKENMEEIDICLKKIYKNNTSVWKKLS